MAGRILRDRRFRQGSHAWPDIRGLEGSFAEFWKRSIISLEGSEHKQARQIALKALNEEFVLSLSDRFTEAAERLVEALRDRDEFDFVECFSEPYAGLAMTAVFGLPDERLGEIVGAAIVLKDGETLEADELREYLAEHLAAFKIPAHIWFREEKLPRIASGKMFKRQLKADYAAELEGSLAANG